MHVYGDGFQYFEEVEDAANWIGQFCRRWGRIGVRQTKEKFGTARVYCSFGWYQLGEVFYPGYCWCKGPKFLWMTFIPGWISNFFIPWQKFVYRTAYKMAIRKWPMIKREIVCCADYPEFFKKGEGNG